MLPVALCVALVAADAATGPAPAPAPTPAPTPAPATATPAPTASSMPIAAAPSPPRPVRREGFLPEGWFLPVGANAGAVSHPTGASGAVVGAEASVVLFPVGHGFWNGAYVDAVYDTASQRTRVSPGLELGYLFLGVDGGPVFQLGDAALRAGVEVRPMLSLAFLHVYGRWGWLLDHGPDDHFSEVGVLLKVPIHLADSSLAD